METIPKSLGEKIASLRKKKYLTQIILSEKLGVSQSTLAMWEKNKREPDLATINQIADFFEVSTDYLLNRTEDPLEGEGGYAQFDLLDNEYKFISKKKIDISEKYREIDLINQLIMKIKNGDSLNFDLSKIETISNSLYRWIDELENAVLAIERGNNYPNQEKMTSFLKSDKELNKFVSELCNTEDKLRDQLLRYWRFLKEDK